MSSLIKVFLIFLDSIVWLSSIMTFALLCSMTYMVVYYTKANRTERDPFDRKSNKENRVISVMLGFGCLCVTAVLVWAALAIMKMI